MRALEREGVVKGYAALLEAAAVGLPISVFVQVTLERQVEQALETFETAIQGRPEVMECYLMTGDADYLLRVVVSDLTAYERFLKEHLTPRPRRRQHQVELRAEPGEVLDGAAAVGVWGALSFRPDATSGPWFVPTKSRTTRVTPCRAIDKCGGCIRRTIPGS